MKKIIYMSAVISALFTPLQMAETTETETTETITRQTETLAGATIYDFSELASKDFVVWEYDDAQAMYNQLAGKYKTIYIQNSNKEFNTTRRFICSKSTGYVNLLYSMDENFPYYNIGYWDYASNDGLKGWNNNIWTPPNDDINDSVIEFTFLKASDAPRILRASGSEWEYPDAFFPLFIQTAQGESAQLINFFDNVFLVSFPQSPISQVFDFLKTLFIGLSDIFAIQLFGFLPIGTIIAIPLIFALLSFILGLFK